MGRHVVTIAMLTGVLLASVAGPAASQVKLGFVDVQKVIARSSAGVQARETLEREKATMQKDLDARRAEVEQLRDEIQKKGMLLSEEARREKEEGLQRRVRDLRRHADDLQKELEKREQALMKRILDELTGVIERIGKDGQYLLVVERRSAGVIYGSPEADLTDEIIRAYDLETSKAKP